MPSFTVTLTSTVISFAEVVVEAPDEEVAEKKALEMAENNSAELEWVENDTEFEVESVEPDDEDHPEE